MRRLVLLALAAAMAGCGRSRSQNYKHCLKLRVGMTREQMVQIMGEPEETFPFVEGKSLDYLRGRTAYEWSNPASMPGPDHVSVNDATGKIESIRCSNVDIEASVYIEPPAPSTAPAAAAAPEPSEPAPAANPAPTGTLADARAAYKAKDLVTALKTANPLAGGGNAQAQLLLGLIFQNAGKAGMRANPVEAARQFYLAGRAKDCEAAALYVTTLGDRGSGVSVVQESEYAASLGCPAAKLLRARMLLDGYRDLLPPDPTQGMALLKEAAEGGAPAAQAELGERLAKDGKDPVEAYRWTLTASRHPLVGPFDDPVRPLSEAWSDDDRKKASASLAALKKSLKPAQVAEAEKRAAAR